MKSVYYSAGLRIRELRESKNFTREKLAEMAEISPKFLYEIEIGSKGFSADTLYKISKALDTNVDYILSGQSEQKITDNIIVLIERLGVEKSQKMVELLSVICGLLDNT